MLFTAVQGQVTHTGYKVVYRQQYMIVFKLVLGWSGELLLHILQLIPAKKNMEFLSTEGSMKYDFEEMDETIEVWNMTELNYISKDATKNTIDILDDNSEINTINYTVTVGNFVVMGIIVIMAVFFRGSKDGGSHR